MQQNVYLTFDIKFGKDMTDRSAGSSSGNNQNENTVLTGLVTEIVRDETVILSLNLCHIKMSYFVRNSAMLS